VVVKQGEPGDDFFIIVDGYVKSLINWFGYPF
jgi:CRP-like cAMP-binding protein